MCHSSSELIRYMFIVSILSILYCPVGYGKKILTTTLPTTTTTTTPTTLLSIKSTKPTMKPQLELSTISNETKDKKSKVSITIGKPKKLKQKLPAVINNSTRQIRKVLEKVPLQNQPNKLTTNKIKRQESKIRKQNNTILIENSKHVVTSSSTSLINNTDVDHSNKNDSNNHSSRKTIKLIGNRPSTIPRINESKNITKGNNNSSLLGINHISGNNKTLEISARNQNKFVDSNRSNKSKSKDRTKLIQPKTDNDNDSRPVARFFFGSNQGRKRFQINVPDKEWRTFDDSSQSSKSSKSLPPSTSSSSSSVSLRTPPSQRILTFIPKYEN